jgi:hypothetical protein
MDGATIRAAEPRANLLVRHKRTADPPALSAADRARLAFARTVTAGGAP